jgi:hypothetical protein
MYTFMFCINKQGWTAAFIFHRLLLSIKLWLGVITMNDVHRIWNIFLNKYKKTTRRELKVVICRQKFNG